MLNILKYIYFDDIIIKTILYKFQVDVSMEKDPKLRSELKLYVIQSLPPFPSSYCARLLGKYSVKSSE